VVLRVRRREEEDDVLNIVIGVCGFRFGATIGVEKRDGAREVPCGAQIECCVVLLSMYV
jgi:hypothetical protein